MAGMTDISSTLEYFTDATGSLPVNSPNYKPAMDVLPGDVGSSPECRNGLCSVGLMRTFCPTCLLLGLVLLPLELVFRGLVWLTRG